MNKDYYINNFKVFDNEGAYIDIRPITILTGCNNSGKSSIVKSLCLLNDFCRQADICLSKSGITDLAKIKLDFHKSPNDIMGSFSKVIHKAEPSAGDDNNAEANENKSFSLKASAYSNYFLQNMFVELTFSNRKEDHLDNGYLKKIEISTTDNEVVYSSEIGGDHMYNFDSLKQPLLYAVYTQYFLSAFRTELSDAQNYYLDWDEVLENSLYKVPYERAINSVIDKYGDNAALRLIGWCSSPGELNNEEYQLSRPKSASLKSRNTYISPDFISSPELNTFLYFPFMVKYKDKTIQELKELFHAAECKPRERELAEAFFEGAERSGCNDLISYISTLENRYFHNAFPFLSESFITPSMQQFYRGHSVLAYDPASSGSSGPNHQIVVQGNSIYPLNLLNTVLMGDKNSYLSSEMSGFEYFIDIDNILTLAITDILQNILPGNLLYSRTEGVSAKRLYSLESGSDFAELIKDYFNKSWRISNSNTHSFGSIPAKEYQPGTFLNKWVNELGLAHSVSITSVANGLGASIHMYSSENDTEGTLLADMGYGSTQLFMTILKIENAIMDSVRMYNLNRITEDGLYEGFADTLEKYEPYLFNNPITVALEEPENHLHPSLQSKLADMLADAYNNYGVQFLVETHSEYLIRKLQLLIARETVDNDHVSILYINSKDRPSYMPLVNRIGVDSEGNLEDVFGPGFFDESIRLTKELIKANIKADEEQN